MNYSFAIARVRLFEGPGTTTDNPVRVLFRLFTTLSFDTHYDGTPDTLGTVGTMYSFLPDAANLPLQPLPGGDGNIIDGSTIDTIPFYATGNFEASPVQHDYDVSGPPNASTVNSQLITNYTSSNQIYAYYGCYLNVYDPSITVYETPVTQLLASVHHCVVAEIACDDSPIPVTTPPVTPQNYDKLAQRNTNIIRSDNSRSYLGAPDSSDLQHAEMMIDWGNTPTGSTAYVYWPEVDASAVLSLANRLYINPKLEAAVAHTLKVTVNRGFTLILIPPASGANFAGLLTIDLPLGVVQGSQFNIVVRRILYGPPARVNDDDRDAAKGTSPIRPRYVTGSFAVTIPVSNPIVLLDPEEQTLSVLKYRLQHWSPSNRWYPVLLRYISYISGRVTAFGGNAALIPAGPPGKFPVPPPVIPNPYPLPGAKDYTGKVSGITYDRFGEFKGFGLRTEAGAEVEFRGREEKVEALVRFAWEKRALITVFEEGESKWPAEVVLRRL
ncbi:hypothetical protein L207DRAFT_641784 [Hyaloscypha variabilis F]|uniref:Uncharacterized protein n=1 Tax=Hyaloscypha variabilis (strain UAMH 11265 / GT02V1 / F) TaxID=1149755 RepID=A0A2J6QVC5_HYAVF|nr:hypothetical protein L207DRAFT_641784 [Hyaloscypha variabilis F]